MTDCSECPACTSPMTVFHEVTGVPVTSCMLVDDPSTALALPRGDLRLAFCGTCGFIANTAFRPELTPYAAGYEETQAFSPRFQAFAAALAQEWSDRYDLRGKHVLEIGAGKGEFLSLMAEVGDNDCLGVDPALDSSRIPTPARGRLRMLPEAYDPRRHAAGHVDAVVCRHTLEHLAQVRDFLLSVRAGADDSTVLLFELPDTERVLEELAFEDVYYEHCSYFTAGSLSRLFRRCGFEVLDLRREYEGQYLVLEARPGPVDPELTHADREDVARTAASVERFSSGVTQTARRWRERLSASAARGGRTVVWGGGSKAVAFLTALGLGDDVAAVVDINPHKQGKAMPGTGHPIVAPSALVKRPPDLVVVMNAVYVDEITSLLAGLGLTPEVIALGA